MSDVYGWADMILGSEQAEQLWCSLFAKLGELAQQLSRNDLHKAVLVMDRLLAESAWDLWLKYQDTAPRTASKLITWWQQPTSYGRAVLVLDALSLRELPVLLKSAEQYHVIPTQVGTTGAEIPSDTDQFAQMLGATSRSSLKYNQKSQKFLLGQQVYTDVLDLPFADCVSSVPNVPDVFLWHTWIDNHIHQDNMTPSQLYQLIPKGLQDAGFWSLVNRLRQGRHLVITADHGYAESKVFSEEQDRQVIEALRGTFGASRYKRTQQPWTQQLMPPRVMTVAGCHVVIGQRKWPVQGGFPVLCHGGASLFEIAVPFIEFDPL